MLSYLKQVPSEFPKFRWIVAVLAAAMLAGCDSGLTARGESLDKEELRGSAQNRSAEVLAQPVPLAWHEGKLPILRYQTDRVRERGWILIPMGVLVFDLKTRQATGYVPLADWQWVGEEYSCLPDLALGPKGEALISSNVVPTLWRIDPETLAVSKHELALDADTDKDVGFTGLAYSAEKEAFFAVSDLGSLWRIDLLFRQARKIPLSAPIPKACGVAIRTTIHPYFGLCVRGRQRDWTINIAPGGRSGNVIARSCPATQPPGRVDGRHLVQKDDFLSGAAPSPYQGRSGL
jgi:hypothetical protein